MFWGLIMEPQKKYSQEVNRAFHISMAALDVTNCTDDVVQVMCGYENRKYLLCTLEKGKIIQCPLDLTFDVGTQVSFVTNGGSHVHLSGYLIHDLEEDMLDLDEKEEDEEDQEVDVSVGNISPTNIVSGKRSKSGNAEGQLNGLPAVLHKKLAAMSKDAPPAKKLKTMDLLQDINSDEDDDDEDSDVNLSDLLGEDDEEEDNTIDMDDDDGEAEEDEEEEEEEGEEEEDEDDLEEESEDDEDVEQDGVEDGDRESDEEVFEAAPQNGSAKKNRKEQAGADKEAKPGAPARLNKSATKKQQQQAKSPVKKTVEGGVIIEDIRQGSGAPAKPGKMVQVYYEGRFRANNKMFDSATKGNGFKFRLGRGEVIKGWDVGVAGMKVGGKRRIVCPPGMAYGAKGSPPTIPPNSALVFEVELKGVN